MIRKVVKKYKLKESDSQKQELRYWLSKKAEERISAVEILRKQEYGSSKRLQRIARVVKQAKS